MAINRFNRGKALSRIQSSYTALSNAITSATGGVISDYDDGSGNKYRAHIFTSTGTLAVNTIIPGVSPNSISYNPANVDYRKIGSTIISANGIEYLVVGGGGGGGTASPTDGGGGGGGAGSLIYGTSFPVSSPNPYTVTIGAGGNGSTTSPAIGSNGTASVFGPGPISASGGGGGGSSSNPATLPTGGSGGGAGSDSGNDTGSVATGSPGGTPNSVSPASGWGNPGGDNFSGYGGAGGGGAGVVGSTAPGPSPPQPGGPGGDGLQYSITGIATHYAGGGGGGVFAGNPNPVGLGGLGGGGDGGKTTPAPSGTYATGGGGGGGRGSSSTLPGGGGGSGIVVVRYQIAELTATAKATGGAISYYGGKTIHTFTSSGTFTVTNPSLTSLETFVVAGGGGGGGYVGGGGGAGGIAYNPSVTVSSSPGAYLISVGAGSAGFTLNGTPSTAFGITALGGGYGGQGGGAVTNASPGGSGGGGASGPSAGGSATQPAQPQPAGTINYGNSGGAATAASGTYTSSGGGGAGGAGETASDAPDGGVGGVGIQAPPSFRNPAVAPGPGTGPQVGGGLGTPGPSGSYYFGGGGGGSGGSTPTGGIGGAGGGGKGGVFPPASPNQGQDGLTNTGGGAGDLVYGPSVSVGRGGSGIVLIAYPS